MKLRLASLIGLAVIAFALPTVVGAASDQAGQCDGYNDPANTKIDTSDDDLVLEAGLTICIHASNGNTGQLVTDGTSTLHDYIVASGLLNEGGQVPGVSNYVIYATTQPTPTPTPTPTDTPSTPTPTVTPTDGTTTGGDVSVGGGTTTGGAVPQTDTETPVSPGSVPWVIALLLGLAAGVRVMTRRLR